MQHPPPQAQVAPSTGGLPGVRGTAYGKGEVAPAEGGQLAQGHPISDSLTQPRDVYPLPQRPTPIDLPASPNDAQAYDHLGRAIGLVRLDRANRALGP